MRKGDKRMFLARWLTDEDRKKIKENRQKERALKHYTYGAVNRMKNKDTGYRIREYKDKY